jgi:hypothetical protein
MGPLAGRRADFAAFPVAVRSKSGPEGRFPGREWYCVTWSAGRSFAPECFATECPGGLDQKIATKRNWDRFPELFLADLGNKSRARVRIVTVRGPNKDVHNRH